MDSSSFIPRSSPHSSHLPTFPGFQLHRHIILRALFKMASSLSGLQVPGLFKSFESSLVATDQARASARLSVLAGATWPFVWLLPCAGSAPRRRPFQLTCQLQGKLVVSKHGGCLRPCFPCISRFHDDRPGYGCTVTIWCSLMLYWLTRGVLRRVWFKQVWLRVLSNPT